jgi:uncharacterized protein (DUF433 family)
MSTQLIQTEHPHIVQAPGVEGGRPHIRNTGLSVALIARFYRMGVSPDELLIAYPQLTPAALFDALSYYHDHKDDIDRALDEVSTLEQVQERYGFVLGPKGKVSFTDQNRDR